MALLWRASSGAISRSTACSAALVSAEARWKKTAATRSSARPLVSIARIVLSKVGGSADCAILVTASRCAAMVASKAGRKCSGRIRSNGGRPVSSQGPSSGFWSSGLVMV